MTLISFSWVTLTAYWLEHGNAESSTSSDRPNEQKQQEPLLDLVEPMPTRTWRTTDEDKINSKIDAPNKEVKQQPLATLLTKMAKTRQRSSRLSKTSAPTSMTAATRPMETAATEVQ